MEALGSYQATRGIAVFKHAMAAHQNATQTTCYGSRRMGNNEQRTGDRLPWWQIKLNQLNK